MTLIIPDCFTIQTKMTSDWHVGSGAGRGEIDSEVQRDAGGLPYIPAKTLTGILRDGCEQVALALDSGNEQGQWHNWVDFLFGDQPALAQGAVEPEPRPAVVCIRSAYFPENLRKALSTEPLEKRLKWAEQQENISDNERQQIAQRLQIKRQLKSAIAFIKPGVAIDSDTGSAKADFLRFEEVVRMGALLTAQNCTLDFSGYPEIKDSQEPNYQQVAYALLIAGTKMAERLGGKRRRGNGTCIITIDAEDKAQDNEWIQWLQKNYTNVGKPPEWKRKALTSKPDLNPAADTTWYTIPLTIKTQTPIVIPKRTIGNVVESLDYVPGRYFLRHIHRKLGDMLNVSDAIACGDLVITNATVKINDEAGRPTPFCLFGKKLDGGLSKGKRVYNRFQEPEPEGTQLKGERSGYLGKFDDSHLPDYKTVPLKIFTHNTIKDEVQRPTTDVGGVYSYQSIPAGTTLIVGLRLPQSLKAHLDQQSSNWWNALDGSLQIGQSKKDQYGSVKITAKEPKQFTAEQANVDNDNLLYVWFLSDVLLRDEQLNPTTAPDVFKHELETQLGVKLREADDRVDQKYLDKGHSADKCDLLSLMMKSRRTESWQVRWGLPRPSMLGWQAGSCVVYEVQGTIDPKKLAELEAKGIGDRRAEGYGQICFNDPLLKNKLSHLKRKDSESLLDLPELQPISQGDPSFEYACLIEKAAWREAIEHQALAIAADEKQREAILGIKILREQGQEPKSQPPMSQLGGLRSAIRRLQNRDNSNSVSEWVDAIKQVDNRRDKWTQGSLDKIRSLVTDFDLIWQELGDFSDLTITQNGVARLKAELWAETIRTLIDVIIRAHKRALEDEIKNHDERLKIKGVA